MPHATDADDDLISGLLGGDSTSLEALGNLTERPLEGGEKSDNAEDFEDIGDDDLIPEEDAEDATNNNGDFGLSALQDDDAQDHENEPVDEGALDDLFEDEPGDDIRPLSPTNEQSQEHGTANTARQKRQASVGASSVAADSLAQDNDGPTQEEHDDDLDNDPAYLEQMRLFKEAQEKIEFPPAPQTADELFSIIHPQFEANKPPRFSQLLPHKKATYISKKPVKVPKPVHPTKVNLELQLDQEKSFRLPGPASTPFAVRQAEAENQGLILTVQPRAEQEQSYDEDLESLASDFEADIGQYKWPDLVAVCQDWDISMDPLSPVDIDLDHDSGFDQPADDIFGDEGFGDLFEQPASKKQKLANIERPLPVFQDVHFSFDDPEDETARLAKRVRLDMNDPHMLVDVQQRDQQVDRKRKYGQFKRDNARGLTKDFARRYNISNDEAYDQLKENRQSKIRSTLGGQAVEHSAPAARLQYPFYKVALTKKEARSFHRPFFSVEPVLARFSALQRIKKKDMRNKPPAEMFPTTPSLSQGDTSHVLLLEYSEEHPSMMSSFGMGNRLLNYYRRRDDTDHSRPKLDIGETEVLTTEDKSPFSIFGDVEPGSTQPTISNGMYRAPVFAHSANSNDFLLVSNKTSMGGRKFFMKNIENLHVVGQEFPSVEIPGTHSRKTTDASKKRLRMLSYRILRKNKKLKNDQILKHLPGSDVPQNRSKMREFMLYDKDRGWVPKEGDVPDEAAVRAMLKPEDICLLDSMQVGYRQLSDAGYNKPKDDDDQEPKEPGNSIDEQLAPWFTTKNFLNACQGKAMLQLHGEGDPTGRGEAFSFIRTSMKGGFQAEGMSIDDRPGPIKKRELGGHSYNVARQQQAYNDTIKKIWNAQRDALSSTQEVHDVRMEDPDEAEDDSYGRSRTPNSAAPGRSRRDDDVASSFSRASARSGTNQVLKIKRTYREKYEGIWTEKVEEERDPRVIKEYLKRKKEIELNSLTISDLKPTGDPEEDKRRMDKLEQERARLARNAERHDARARAKGITAAGSPDAADSPDANTPAEGGAGRGKGKKKMTGQTQRKCANCGQVGHIKTNKRECPMLNGTMKQPEGFGASAFGSVAPATNGAGSAPAGEDGS